ncbi:MAG: arylsulfatase [Candidatus Hodarchaeota archaeon]
MKSYEPFKGKIGVTTEESTPWWPLPKRSNDGSPNIVIILFDDTGFSHFGCYGSTIETPNIDKLAEGGLRYTNFHTTALCSPTRACLMTGRNHHAVGMRAVSNMDTGFQNSRGYITPHAATMAEILHEEGYINFMVGKWHLAPMHQASAAGPFDHWPLQRGFDRFYGFLQGETNQFYPELSYDNHHIDPPYGPEEGYHVSEDLVDQSIGFIRDTISILPDRPFFLYLAFGATHAPHQAPKEYLDKYRGRFDAGWDVIREEWYQRQLKMGVIPPGTELAPRNPGVAPWDSLSENQQKFACRLQEAFAAFLDHTDHQIGRLVSFLEDMEQLDNTLFMVLSDNGASQEGGPAGTIDEVKFFNRILENPDKMQDRLDDIGGPNSHSNYPWGWAQVGNTPLKWYKQNTFGGGIRDPCVIHWPKRIQDRGGIRNQFHHISDVLPTILELLEIEHPPSVKGYNQMPITGTPMGYTFDDPNVPTQKHVQYFEMFAHRGIWADGWKAVTYHQMQLGNRIGNPISDSEWELYHLDEDFSEIHNLAEEKPDKLRKMINLWWTEAGDNGVLPIDLVPRFPINFRPGTPHATRSYTYYPPISHIPPEAGAAFGNRSWNMTADIQRLNETDEGVLLALGTQNSGISWYIKDNHLVFDYNFFTDHHIVRSDRVLPTGDFKVGVQFIREGRKGHILLFINDEKCGTITVPQIMGMISSIGIDIGKDILSAVSSEYKVPFEFPGTIKKIHVDVPKYRPPAKKREDEEINTRAELHKQ